MRREIDIFDLACMSANILHDNYLSTYSGERNFVCLPYDASLVLFVFLHSAIPSFHHFRHYSPLSFSANESLWKGIKRASHQPSLRRVRLQRAFPDISITRLPADTGRDRDLETQRQPFLLYLDSMNHLACPGQVFYRPSSSLFVPCPLLVQFTALASRFIICCLFFYT